MRILHGRGLILRNIVGDDWEGAFVPVAEQPADDSALPLIECILLIEGRIDLHHIPFDGFKLLLEEGGEIHLSHEADSLGILLVGRGQVGFLRNCADLALQQAPDGEDGLGKLFLA